ncbi:prosaposin-like [Contarinia nasturtii]|uniref:prosaposin-like n=1 Tax=Contarinia nasturtii TaxID=265458 RepID=UPI0012D389E4|nr:prosaposin-like [Contarinia nasturtii]
MKKFLILTICALAIFAIDAYEFDSNENFIEDPKVEQSPETDWKGIFSPQCKICEEVMRKVRKEIGRESSREHIKHVLKKMCSIVPHKRFRQKCSARVDKDGDRIVDMFQKEQSGKVICIAMGFCGAYMDETSEEYDSSSNIELFSIQCLLCEKVMQKVKKEIGRESSRDHIKDVLKKACSVVPDKRFRRKCVERIEDDHIVDMLINDATTKAICVYFGFC